jgi:hypothetical protein
MAHDQRAAMQRYHHRPHFGIVVMVNIGFDAKRTDLFVDDGLLFKRVGGIQIEDERCWEDQWQGEQGGSKFHLVVFS